MTAQSLYKRVTDTGEMRCSDVNECEEMQINCGPDKRCFNRRGDFQCVDVSCPDNYQRDPQTGYVLSGGGSRLGWTTRTRRLSLTKNWGWSWLREAVSLGHYRATL